MEREGTEKETGRTDMDSSKRRKHSTDEIQPEEAGSSRSQGPSFVPPPPLQGVWGGQRREPVYKAGSSKLQEPSFVPPPPLQGVWGEQRKEAVYQAVPSKCQEPSFAAPTPLQGAWSGQRNEAVSQAGSSKCQEPSFAHPPLLQGAWSGQRKEAVSLPGAATGSHSRSQAPYQGNLRQQSHQQRHQTAGWPHQSDEGSQREAGRGVQGMRQIKDHQQQETWAGMAARRPRYESHDRPECGGEDSGQRQIGSVLDMMSRLTRRKLGGNQLFLSGKRGLLEAGVEEAPLTRRSAVAKGTTGQRVTLRTNLFKFDLAEGKNFNHYDVSFSPTIESTRLKRKLLGKLEQTLGIEKQYVTDGSSLFTSVAVGEVQDLEVVVRDVHYKMKIKKVATVKTNSKHIIQILNIIFGNILQNNIEYRWNNGNYYDYAAKINVDGTSLSAYPGFFTSILNYEHGMRLMLDISHKIITSQNAWEACGYDYRKARAKLIGKIVYTCYNGKTYKIEDIEVNKSVDHAFHYKGQMISIRNYYKEKYGITPSDDKQPLLVVKPNRREERAGAPDVIYLLPEFCLVTGIDERDRSNRSLMSKLDVITKPNPDVRAKKIQDFASKLQNDKSVKEVMNAFGIDFSASMDEVQARILPGVVATQNLPSVTRGPLLVPKPINKWIVIYGNEIISGDVSKLIEGVVACMREMRMSYRQPELMQYQSISDLQDKLRSCPRDTDVVLILLRTSNRIEYSSAKLTLCVQNPMPSQVVTSFVAQKNNPSIYSKIALQINCKLGGAGWSIKNMSTKDTMIIGVDTYHDSVTRGSSYMGVVATMNDLCTKYHTTWSKQDVGREIAVNFRTLTTECLKAYAAENNNKPCRRVVVYRDGVGDGQLEQLLNSEVRGVEEALVDMKWKSTGVVYVVVKKRVHARFFASLSCRQGPTYDNAPRGTIVDSVATRPNWIDFYLANQKVTQGTLTPTHFNVLLNSTNMTIDEIQMLSYQQCYMYFSWTDAIRVPAPCQYAHKVAFLIGEVLHHYPDARLKNRLFYL